MVLKEKYFEIVADLEKNIMTGLGCISEILSKCCLALKCNVDHPVLVCIQKRSEKLMAIFPVIISISQGATEL